MTARWKGGPLRVYAYVGLKPPTNENNLILDNNRDWDT